MPRRPCCRWRSRAPVVHSYQSPSRVGLNHAQPAPRWNGDPGVRDERSESVAFANFGHGMFSWAFPYFLRPPPGRNVLVRGVATMPKAGVSPLEGIVEADWYSTGLHIVHKLSRPDGWISYEANEPIAMLVPQRRGDVEAFEPVVQDLDPETTAEYRQWRIKRQALLDKIGTREDVHASELDLDYLHGRNSSGQQVVCPHAAKARGFGG